jgi:tetratricopeptide (TPR) repeat protein
LKKIPQKYIIVLGIITVILACSTKKDNFATRNFQALNTKYNVLYNGNVAYDKGIATVEQQYLDNYWETLPVERQQPIIDSSVSELAKQKTDTEKTKNPDFERAELKATKAIQRRSMNIDGSERNTQIDEAYLLLGKSRYYDQRFIPALEAFNYILYKYPKSDKINDAKIWVEKTNMRLDNDDLAIGNLTKLMKEIKFKDQTFADANAILAQAYINVKQKDSAVSKLTNAIKFTNKNDEKARFSFIKGQLQEQMELPDSAFATYQSIIDMKRKSPRIYTMHAQTRQANQFDFAKGDTVIFLEKYNKLLADRENRPFLDVLNHQMGLFYEQAKKPNQAIAFYNKSLKAKSQDTYLDASNYRNSAEIYFDKAKYITAGKYYDSTMTKLKVRTREFNFIKKKRENLDDVIKYEGIVAKNDSILKVLAMSPSEKTSFYETFISKIKSDEEKAKLLADKAKLVDKNKNNANSKGNDSGSLLTGDDPKNAIVSPPKNDVAPTNFGGQSNFYFYNPTTVEYGRVEFRKIWGDRKLQENWRNASLASTSNAIENTDDDVDLKDKPIERGTDTTSKTTKTESNSKYDASSYIAQLPKKQSDIATLIKDRNFAYFQLGVIYKEKFKEYKLAQDKLETLLSKNPEERLVLPSMYNLYKIYQILNENDKAAAMKAAIIRQYPTSRYAQILSKSESDSLDSDSPEVVYNELYRMYQNAEYRNLIPLIDKKIDHFTGDEIVPKLELLKANNIGKVTGLAAYKKEFCFVDLSKCSRRQRCRSIYYKRYCCNGRITVQS